MFIFKKIFNYDKNTATKESKENLQKIDKDKKVKDDKKKDKKKKDDYTTDPFFFT